MNDSGTLDAEYRAFIKALHPATVETVVAVDTFWDDLYPAIVDVAERALEDRDPDPRDPGELDFYREWRETIRPKLLTLVAGHPDPDVRNAAEVLDKRLRNALFYMNPTHAASEKGEEVTVALDRGHDGLADLRRAVYHAPFRISRPEPNYTGRPARQEPVAAVVVSRRRRA